MNLKSAARVLGVHYQTAYRWVRSGELPAMRHGDGYEISDEAINLFVARRDARRRIGQGGASPVTTHPSDAHLPASVDALIAETEELIRVGADTAKPALSHLLRGIAELFDVLAVVHVLTRERPQAIATTLWWHAECERHALWSRMLSRPDACSITHLAPALDAGHAVCIDHVPLDLARTFIDDEFVYLLDSVYPHSVHLTPLVGPCDTVGVMAITIDRPGRVFSAEERTALDRLAGVATAAIVRSRSFDHAARLREFLHTDITRRLASTPDRVEATGAALAAVADAAGSAFLMTPAGTFVAVSEAFSVMLGHPASSLVGERVASIVRPEDEATDRKVLARLWSGELDHTCLRRTRRSGDKQVEIDAHWSVVRWPDLEPAFIVATQSLVFVRPDDWAGNTVVPTLLGAIRSIPDVTVAAPA